MARDRGMTKNESEAKRKAENFDVPQLGQDAAERKRALNVLAQRRYRQRRREQLERLRAQANTTDDFDLPRTQSDAADVHTTHNVDSVQSLTQVHSESRLTWSDEDGSALVPGVYDGDRLPEAVVSQQDYLPVFPENTLNFSTEDQCLWDPLLYYPASASTSPSGRTSSPSSGSAALSLISAPVARRISEAAKSSITAATTPYSFSDEANFDMPEVKLLSGCASSARRLNVQDLIWSITSLSPFAEPGIAMAQFNHLPVNLRPTSNQMSIPHHPIIDLLPWPSVRDRMIMILSQPPEVRPPSAALPTALFEFVYDLEDSAEGMRIFENDPYSEQNWEIGEKVFKSWWWMFDKDIIRRSNQLRAFRGAPMLGSGSVLGEVAWFWQHYAWDICLFEGSLSPESMTDQMCSFLWSVGSSDITKSTTVRRSSESGRVE
ncbi:hypothetical protein A1O1_05717 [Capronia coronata CBS 617.96]|uniref:BZIP domain-containing protein n=1 Tax=Capronia coronata CBS 617.96 TaxID=1182541 RepID=W9XYS7_9EURO|nr:uncharacterized protein A1O1_05717 [Capronia coronata CBS 617.96]EXJ85353.1 hypothetical protein A1O1_05717 [Capronia coronata CBS 617.96]